MCNALPTYKKCLKMSSNIFSSLFLEVFFRGSLNKLIKVQASCWNYYFMFPPNLLCWRITLWSLPLFIGHHYLRASLIDYCVPTIISSLCFSSCMFGFIPCTDFGCLISISFDNAPHFEFVIEYPSHFLQGISWYLLYMDHPIFIYVFWILHF